MRLKLTVLAVVMCICTTLYAAALEPDKATAAKVKKTPKIDLVFCVDTTSSMADEIEVVKERIKDMISKVASGKPAPEVRVGIVAYRDRGDEYVVRKTELTRDIDAIVKAVNELKADGGGDKEESVNEAIHTAVSEINWDSTPGITKLIYLIGDAGPKKYEQDFNPETERAKALKGRIIINAIGCSDITESEVEYFKKMAQGSEGTFTHLTYREEYIKSDGSRMVVLKEGSKTYSYAPAAALTAPAADWKMGAVTASSSGAACAAAPAALADAKRATTSDTRTKDGWQVNAATMNNLDAVMTQQAQQIAAKQQGIVYDKSELLPLLRELQGAKSGISDETKLVIKDKKTWEDTWKKHQSYQAKTEELPNVDFSKEMVIVLVAGAKQNAVLREMTEMKNRIVVTYAITPAGKDSGHAFHFVVVKQSTLPVVWEKSK